ncbi:hypothetical protein HPP92_021744 [Vanilla planifolia]|uniref:Homing endonuclease LAGLIDADG domain-containing protein n=1 Tax=Vanilla planifolia TaxID=51239 RepID=A0A835PQX9_VANPL|nr:hypothetical protein HPP92_021744 [Vanilla planifolia]
MGSQDEVYAENEEENETVVHKVEYLQNVTSVDKDTRHLSSPEVEVIRLEELPDQWKRSRIAWLCKELPAHKHRTLVRILNAQRKWIRQAEATYIIIHCLRIRENEASYKVYSWMAQQHWFHFDFAVATKLADYLGKSRKFEKCREIFDAMIKQGRVPSESTFHILIVAYLSASAEACIKEACYIYNQMIQLGGYRPRLSLHNSLFRALLDQPRSVSNYQLKQAEFIYHNMLTSYLEVQKDIYSGLIWLHSVQDRVDRERIDVLRHEMESAGFEEGKDVLISILRACSKQGDVEEAEKTWAKLCESECTIPSQAFVYLMELHSRAGDPIKSLEIFKEMNMREASITAAAYLKIIEIMTKANEIAIAEALMDDYMESGLKLLAPAFQDLMSMYFRLGMYDRLETVFSKCLTKCHANKSIYNIYLKFLVRINNLEKAEQIFDEMLANETISVDGQSCDTILRGYLAIDDCEKAAKVYDLMRQKKYDIQLDVTEKMEHFISQNRKVSKRPARLKLDEEQREILIGFLLGGVQIVLKKDLRNQAILFQFDMASDIQCSLRNHVYDKFYEWLNPSSRSIDKEKHETPYQFSTISHACFDLFADQFQTKGRPTLPKLIHRWLSPRVLAYWYMCAGFRISSGDIVLKLMGVNHENIERIVRQFQIKSIACKVKRKGRYVWIGFQGTDAASFWNLVEPFVLENVRDFLMPSIDAVRNDSAEGKNIQTHYGSDLEV